MPIPYPDGLFMVEHAIRAPSGHNTQPWLFHLGADHITITPDLRRRLPVVDGDDRELFISLGCAVENLCLAAAARHWRTQVQVQESDAGPSRIRVDLTANATLAPPPLFDVLARSQTNRAMYDGRRVPTATLTPLLAACASPALPVQAWPRGSAEFERLAQYILEGNTCQMRDAAFKRELLSWIRFNRQQAEQRRDGISHAALGAPSLPAWLARPIVRRALNPSTQNRGERRKLDSSSHLVLLGSLHDTPGAWVDVGRALQRLLLMLTQAGVAHAFCNQPCEVAPLRQRLRAEPFAGPGLPQLLLRIGYARPLPFSLRRPVQEVFEQASG
ncbi:nitroreductase [Comamonadaceae bacterium OH2545_COT-014]|nr:nitroreductase [Comamonadaceae bacterium OH2545_COT-014]